MQRIRIITLGTLKESYWKEAQEEYLKRLSPFVRVEIIELPEEPFRDTNDRERIMHIEADKILARIPEHAIVIALDERGKSFSSPALAQEIESLTTHGDELVFVIGGPQGLHDSIRERARALIALSSLTFTHQMVRIVLLEQLYRAYMIMAGRTYHY